MEHAGFGEMLARLLDHRGVSSQDLSELAGLTGAEVTSVLSGQLLGDTVLRRLAPALGFRAVDLFVLAGLDVPDDLAPLDAQAGRWSARIVSDAACLPEDGRHEIVSAVRSLPQQERVSHFVPKLAMPRVDGPGALLIRMLAYRNLNWLGMARALAFVTPTYLSAPTYGLIGSSRMELTPRLVTDFAALLGFASQELALLTGVHLVEAPEPAAPEAVEAAALLWETRRLTADQAQSVAELAHARRREIGDLA